MRKMVFNYAIQIATDSYDSSYKLNNVIVVSILYAAQECDLYGMWTIIKVTTNNKSKAS